LAIKSNPDQSPGILIPVIGHHLGKAHFKAISISISISISVTATTTGNRDRTQTGQAQPQVTDNTQDFLGIHWLPGVHCVQWVHLFEVLAYRHNRRFR
jgi:hypothetical protein